MRDFLRSWLVLSVMWLGGCSEGSGAPSTTTTTTTGTGGGASGPCAVDCSSLKTSACELAICNTGQVEGPLNTCIVIPAANGTACDDGLFCTTNDTCNGGACVGGPPNDCGMVAATCSSVTCDETSKSCSVAPAADGTACAPADLCQVDGTCTTGVCMGQPKDCSFSPLSECNTVACDSTTGKCTGTPDPTKDGTQCVLTGNLCNVAKTCSSGQCAGGTPEDCSALDSSCQIGMCDGTSGLCAAVDAPAGTACQEGVRTCQVGACNATGACVSATAPDGTACNDHDACTMTDTCVAGVCSGMPITGCQLYFSEGFESCPDGWTLDGDWQCGTPTSMSPVTPHTGHGVIATQLDGLYHNGDNFDTCVADSPAIDLTKAQSPHILFWAWVYTEGGSFDGWNMDVSSDGGQTFTEVMTVAPPYPLLIATEPAWGGNLSALGWQPYTADLTAWAGQSIALRFAFRSDPAGVYPGVYIDDITIAEPLEIPLAITTPSPLADVYVDQHYSATITKVGGTTSSVWSIDSGAVNATWLSINAATGVISGTPSSADVGPVSFTVRIQEPMLPSNYEEQTFSFEVKPNVYYTSFEGTCPDGWTLTGDWQCGVPMSVGPATAFDGTQCIGTGMGQDYSNNDTFGGTTATSPPISLAGLTTATLTFRMWLDTQGGATDGANLQISTDGGNSYSVLTIVTPVYTSEIGSDPAWGGDESALGWQLVTADLTAYVDYTVRLRFGFQSDGSLTDPGVYIDDFLVE